MMHGFRWPSQLSQWQHIRMMVAAFISGMLALWFAMDLVEWSNDCTASVWRGRVAAVGLVFSLVGVALHSGLL